MLVLSLIAAANIVAVLVLASAAMPFGKFASAALDKSETCFARAAIPATLNPHRKARSLKSNMELFESTMDGIAHMNIWCN